MTDAETLGFEVDWYDKQADVVRKFHLTVFRMHKGPLEASMYDPKGKRSFLKRTAIPELRLEDLFLGSTITLHGRQLKLREYMNERTKIEVEFNRESFKLVTVPSAFYELGKIITCLEGLGLTISRLRLVNEGGPVVAIEAAGADADFKWETVAGTVPSGMVREVSREQGDSYFRDFPNTAAFDHCTLCVLRPHLLKARQVGAVIHDIMTAGFEVSAARTVHMDAAQASEFLEVYQNVMPNFSDMVAGMCESPCLALELRKQSNVVEDFRTLCGPYDLDMARHLRPETLRARFGLDNAKNGVHCTDLEEDAEREVRYMFELLN